MFISWNCGAPFCNFEYLIQGNSQIFSRKCIFCLRIVWVLFWCCLLVPTSVQFSSVAQSCLTLCHLTNHSRPGFRVHYQLLEFTQTHVHWVVMPSSHLDLCRPIFLLPPIPSSIRVFSSESTLCMRWPEYWSFSFSTSPSNKHPGLISFRMDWLYLLAVQGTLKSLIQHILKASTFQCSAFFTDQLSHPYMTIGKTIALIRCTFVGIVMSLLLNMLPRLVTIFLPSSKCL